MLCCAASSRWVRRPDCAASLWSWLRRSWFEALNCNPTEDQKSAFGDDIHSNAKPFCRDLTGCRSRRDGTAPCSSNPPDCVGGFYDARTELRCCPGEPGVVPLTQGRYIASRNFGSLASQFAANYSTCPPANAGLISSCAACSRNPLDGAGCADCVTQTQARRDAAAAACSSSQGLTSRSCTCNFRLQVFQLGLNFFVSRGLGSEVTCIPHFEFASYSVPEALRWNESIDLAGAFPKLRTIGVCAFCALPKQLKIDIEAPALECVGLPSACSRRDFSRCTAWAQC